jgi:hypothetical protein
MKKILITAFILRLVAGLQAQVTHEVKINPNDYGLAKSTVITVDNTNYTRFNLPVYPISEISGYPELPVIYVRLIIPPGQDVSSINIVKTISANETLTNLVYPIQEEDIE